MTEALIGFFGKYVKDIYLLTACLSLLPVTEIKGSLLFAVAAGADPLLAAGCAFLSSALLSVLLTFALPPILTVAEKHRGIKRLTSFLTERLREKAEKLQNAKEKEGAAFGVFLFVAIPLPLTGIFMGALLATILRLPRKQALVALIGGGFVSVGIVLSVALLAGEQAKLVFNLFLLLALGMLAFSVIRGLLKKRKEKA